jgi:Mg2+ and Co2+ transporter CorA
MADVARFGVPGVHFDPLEGSHSMLWTILIILVIVAVALFIFNQVRGRRGL